LSSGKRVRETFRFPIRVYYEDTDAAGVVYYANYLKFMERARTEWLASIGFELAALERVQRVVFVVRRAEIDYRRPAELGQYLDATMTLTELGRASMTVIQEVMRNDVVLTHARIGLACLDRTSWRPARIPAALHARLENLA
jgi:acyl-CoA thioester hydrolase